MLGNIPGPSRNPVWAMTPGFPEPHNGGSICMSDYSTAEEEAGGEAPYVCRTHGTQASSACGI